MWRFFGLPQHGVWNYLLLLEKVYFVACRFDVKLQADNLVRWDVAERLNRKQ
jgi:hypothetical protein